MAHLVFYIRVTFCVVQILIVIQRGCASCRRPLCVCRWVLATGCYLMVAVICWLRAACFWRTAGWLWAIGCKPSSRRYTCYCFLVIQHDGNYMCEEFGLATGAQNWCNDEKYCHHWIKCWISQGVFMQSSPKAFRGNKITVKKHKPQVHLEGRMCAAKL